MKDENTGGSAGPRNAGFSNASDSSEASDGSVDSFVGTLNYGSERASIHSGERHRGQRFDCIRERACVIGCFQPFRDQLVKRRGRSVALLAKESPLPAGDVQLSKNL